MRKSIVFLFAIILTTTGYSREILPEKYKMGLAAGTNMFPLFYGGPYGLNLGGFITTGKWIYRIGVNGNLYSTNNFRFSPPPKYKYYGIGVELGVEKPLLSDSSKWLINPAILIYYGRWTELGYLTSGNIRNTTTNIGIGPLLLIGRRINAAWTVQLETSVSFGKSMREGDGIDETVYPEYHFWKLFGLGVRYTFGVLPKETE